MARIILSYFRKRGFEVAVRPDRYGVSIMDLSNGRQVARLRICGEDSVEVLWRNGDRWDTIGDLGGLRMSVREAMAYIADDHAGTFWLNR